MNIYKTGGIVVKVWLKKIRGALAFPGKPGRAIGAGARGGKGGKGGNAWVGGENSIAIGGAGGSVIVGGDHHSDYFFTTVMQLAAVAMTKDEQAVSAEDIFTVAIEAGLVERVEKDGGNLDIHLSDEGEKRFIS